jgi:uncharacterized membrane protein YciS (DUF1049 family)
MTRELMDSSCNVLCARSRGWRMRTLICLIFIIGFTSGLIVTSPPARAEQSVSPIAMLTDQQLQREKLELEIQELRNKNKSNAPLTHPTVAFLFGIMNQPVVITLFSLLISLLIGSLAFTKLSERRARRDKRLEKAIEFVDDVATDTNAAFAPLMQYIRYPHRRNPALLDTIRQEQLKLVRIPREGCH